MQRSEIKSTEVRARTLHGLITENSRSRGNDIAVVFEGESLSYAELESRSNQLAHHLRKMDLSPGDLIGLCVERSIEMVVGLLGIMKAGCAYIPIDPAYPADRVDYMLSDSEASLVLTQENIAPYI